MSAIDFSDPATIAFLTEALTEAGVDGLEISRPGGQLRIVVNGQGDGRISSAETPPRTAASASSVVKAPMAGHFCVEHATCSDSEKSLPRSICEADVVGFIRVGQVMLPLRAGRSGLLTRLLAEPGAVVGFGDPLFEIELHP
ncbi:acetyl-CoA carboxylase biotin carboxyl carrier protein [Rhizobium lentis]|uniref:Acetyl-CoA carboxylase n=1 Tax=Rhizobium lentis TaxID=1138194 RepID=A0A9Q3QYR5_9HYPH|nr:acetyl-CoA carboxylase [Rhizobium lentis]MBX4999427.1 acetyl-CoA carboxylase [Rhizobium lentis]MBX5011308.1 acetyl-CoA carboxylase [Rhizobium lentis]MBX5015288.1 acetyl-CoA carboxylase [Rhizobium lentis]MBX5025158.1 acetyl-CoA carboxylase [Rhizobium lentis]MBX5043743.1 acetyl-CoA carboxylase [Rhizobium lentis]